MSAPLPWGVGTFATRLAATTRDLRGILELQSKNLERHLDVDEVQRDGFVTVQHGLPTLEAMHAAHPSVVATSGDRIVGYVIMMPPALRALVPVLAPMFEVFDGLSVRGKPLGEQRYFVNGQVCVDRLFRGSGVFDAMFARLRERYAGFFDMVVTEIATRNVRSCRAHERVGFRTIHEYVDPVIGEAWKIVVWDWRS